MGVFQERIEVGTPQAGGFEEIDAVVDSGATYTTLPASMLERLEVTRHERATFEIADGSFVERDIGLTWVRVRGRSTITTVVFADDGVRPLLGAVTLQQLRLAVDLTRERLIPAPAFLLLF